ncbi:hypothetical protein B1218_36690, partial [Pseudomonas ogarae]
EGEAVGRGEMGRESGGAGRGADWSAEWGGGTGGGRSADGAVGGGSGWVVGMAGERAARGGGGLRKLDPKASRGAEAPRGLGGQEQYLADPAWQAGVKGKERRGAGNDVGGEGGWRRAVKR